MRGRWALAVVLVLLGTFIVAPTSSVGASDGDGSYDLPVWFNWDEAVLDVLIVPPNHGQIVNGNGVLNGGDPGELTPFNSYLKAIEASVADWDRGIEMFGPEWLRSGVVTNVFVVGRDSIPAGALTDPEVLITTDETKANILGVAVSSRPCLVDNSKFFLQSFTYEDMYNVNSQEYGHCLGLEHVVENHPEHDAMAGQYVDPVGAKGGHLHCVSNLDVLGLTAVFGPLFNQPSSNTVSLPVVEYGTTCAPPTSGAPPPSSPTPTPSDTTAGTPGPSPSPSPSPSSSASPAPDPSPSASPAPSPSASPAPSPTAPSTFERSVTLRLRRHLVGRGAVRAAEEADHCYSRVQVHIQKRVGGRWQMVRSSMTGADGSFRIRIADRTGRYRALVKRQFSERGDCAGAISPRRLHRH